MSKLGKTNAPNYDRLDPNDEYFGEHLNTTGIEPVGYKVLIEIELPADLKRAQDNGLVIPEKAADRHTYAAVCAKVIQLGKGCYRPDNFPEGPWCKPGDYIVMSPHSGTRVFSPTVGSDFRFINEDSVEGIVPGPEFVERGH